MLSRLRQASTSLPTICRSRALRPAPVHGISTGFHLASRWARSGAAADGDSGAVANAAAAAGLAAPGARPATARGENQAAVISMAAPAAARIGDSGERGSGRRRRGRSDMAGSLYEERDPPGGGGRPLHEQRGPPGGRGTPTSRAARPTGKGGTLSSLRLANSCVLVPPPAPAL